MRAGAVVAFVMAAGLAHAQEKTEAPGDKPGLFNEIGKLLKSPADLLPSLSKTEPPAPAQSAPVQAPSVQAAPIPEPAPAAAAAAPPPTRMFPGMANGREACPASAGGGPDCQAATDKLCQSKGYKSGKSLSTDSAFACNVKQARADGRKPCGTEYYVTSAFCQ